MIVKFVTEVRMKVGPSELDTDGLSPSFGDLVTSCRCKDVIYYVLLLKGNCGLVL